MLKKMHLFQFVQGEKIGFGSNRKSEYMDLSFIFHTFEEKEPTSDFSWKFVEAYSNKMPSNTNNTSI